MIKEKGDEEVMNLAKLIAENKGIKPTKEQLEISMMIEKESDNFLDYVDARFDALKIDPRYKIALGIAIASRILAALYHANPDSIKELSAYLQKGVVEQMEMLDEEKKEGQK